MKVLLLNRSYYPNVGGIENSLYYLSREFKKAGHEVAILTQQIPLEGPMRKEYATLIKYPRFRVCKYLLPILPYVEKRNITKWIFANRQQLEADVVISRDPMLGLAYAKVFEKTRMIYIPAVILKYYNKGIRKASSLKGRIKEVLRYCQLKIEGFQQKKILQISNKVLVFSKNVKKQIARGKLCKEEKVSVCYPGVADKFAMPIEELACPSVANYIFVGRLVAEKNLLMLIEAFAQLQGEQKHLTLVGDGDQRPLLEKRVQELALQDKVSFVGVSNAPEEYYSKAAFFVIPSTYESFGQVIIEALSMGLPVIGFASIAGKTLTATEELVEENVTGFVCKEFSSEALHLCLEKAQSILNEPKIYLAMRKNAIQFVNENCSWQKLAQQSIR